MNRIPTAIDGLVLVELDLHADERGHFREVFHAEKMRDLGLDGFVPIQQNVSHNVHAVLRGIHAEPWNKLIHITYGEVFAALVDLRAGSATFGQHEPVMLDPTRALFVPRGFGNSFQVTSEFAVYSYLVDQHWRPGPAYPAIAFDDPDIAIAWPIDPSVSVISEKDRANPSFADYPRSNDL